MQPRDTYAGLLREGWEREAENWIAWARAPGHDSYWRFHRDRFLALLPPPGRLTLDLGCGEGRLARDLAAQGHHLVGIDRSPTLAAAAAAAGSPPVVVADAAALPFAAATFDLVVAFMSLQDIDDMLGAVVEAGRVLEPGGRLCLAIVHPLNALGQFTSREAGAEFVISGDYFKGRKYTDHVDRAGLGITFHQQHRPLQAYFAALEAAGLLTESLREVGDTEGRWARMPLFLHVRARKP